MSTATAAADRTGRRTWLRVAVPVAAAGLLIPVAGTLPMAVLPLAGTAVALVYAAYAHPPVAAYVILAATPLTAGLPRSGLVPLLRPHEVLGVLVGAGVALRAANHLRAGGRLRLRPGPVDVAILLMACAGSVLPLLWMAARGLAPTQEDLLYASAIWKFYALFVLVRASVRTERQVRRCLYVSVAAGTLVAVVVILQSLQVGPVVEIVGRLYPGDESGGGLAAGRGSATIGNPIAAGDVLAFNLAICLGLLLRRQGQRRLLVPAAALSAFGALASGQMSGVLALAIAVVTVAVVTGHVRRLLLALVPTALVALVVLQPVLRARLNQLDVSTGLPQSWQVRLVNLHRYVWPQVFSGETWLFGVRPSARLRVDAAWGPYIYIESGHTWLLWTGGIPLVAAYLFFVWVAVRRTARVARLRHDAVGVAAIAGVTSLVVVFVLMSFDPHLTMRGAADLLFALLALGTAGPVGLAPAAGSPS
jgi:hypothetical protein